MRLWRWLLPGLGLKRWLAVIAAGMWLVGLGATLSSGGALSEYLNQWLIQQGKQHGWPVALSADSSGWSPLWLWGLGAAVVLFGIGLVAWGVLRLTRAVVHTLLPEGHRQGVSAETFYQRRNLRRGPRVVAIGGGTGIPALLRGLKELTANITAVITVADDGGSSGQLRSEYNILPPGDIRNCLVALADTEPLMERLFQYRFDQGTGLAGHPFGNLFILAMTAATGNFYEAVKASSQVLAVRGRVIPSTLSEVTLTAELVDGRILVGESKIGRAPVRIKRVRLTPEDCQPLPDAIAAIEQADVIILGPGSLYTSIMPNLLVPGVADAIRRSPALKVYICNIMTQPGETQDFTATDHVRALINHAGFGIVDICLVNSQAVPADRLERYRKQGAQPVAVDEAELERLGVRVWREDLLDGEGDWIRHNPGKLATAIRRMMIQRNVQYERRPWELFLWKQRMQWQEWRERRRTVLDK
jgi:uncharacterized cofD-like protein